MTSIELDMIQTAGIGALALLVGMVLTRKVAFLQKFCVPSPVSGGIIFSFITLILYAWFDVEVSFDGTLKDVFMLAFFTSVGFQSDLKVIKQGGKLLVIMLTLLVGIIALQNLMPMGITKLMGVGTLLSWLLAKTGITFPTYFGALILAAIVRNTIGFVSYKEGDKWEKAEKLLDMNRIISVGNICLSLFL